METTKQTRLTKRQRTEIVALLNTGATPTETASLLSLSPSQVESVHTQMKRAIDADSLHVTEARKISKASASTTQTADVARGHMAKGIAKLAELISKETDTSKVATAIKVLHTIAMAGEERSEVTQIVSRLRGR